MNKNFNPLQWISLKCEEHVALGVIESVGSQQPQVGSQQPNRVSQKIREKCKILVDEVQASGIDITAEYDEWVVIAFATFNTFGEGGWDFFNSLSKNYPTYTEESVANMWQGVVNCSKANGADKSQARATTTRIFNIAKKYGINVHELYNERVGGEQVSALKEVAKIRYNNLLERVEFKYDVENENAEYEPMTERDYHTIFTRLNEKVHVNKSDLDSLIYSKDISPDYDPLLEYLESLPEWDESQPDYINDLFLHIQFKDEENKDFYLKYLKMWFVNMVALPLGYTDDNQLMPVFVGSQQVGKTYFVKSILPPALRRYYFTVYPGQRSDKDQQFLFCESILANFDEFTIGSRMTSSSMKATISSVGNRMRDSYGHTREQRKRKCSFTGTSNDDKYIFEAAGDRRFLSVLVKSTTDLNESPLPYAGAYAQAWYYIKNKCFNYKLTKADAEEISSHNKPFVMDDLCETLIQVYYRIPKPEEEGVFVSAGEILKKLNSNNREVTPSNIGKAMKNLGFETIRPKNRVKYYVIEVEYQTRKEENAKEGKEYHDRMYGTMPTVEEGEKDVSVQGELPF